LLGQPGVGALIDLDRHEERERQAERNQAWFRIAVIARESTRVWACVDPVPVMIALDHPEARTAFHPPVCPDRPSAGPPLRNDRIA